MKGFTRIFSGKRKAQRKLRAIQPYLTGAALASIVSAIWSKRRDLKPKAIRTLDRTVASLSEQVTKLPDDVRSMPYVQAIGHQLEGARLALTNSAPITPPDKLVTAGHSG